MHALRILVLSLVAGVALVLTGCAAPAGTTAGTDEASPAEAPSTPSEAVSAVAEAPSAATEAPSAATEGPEVVAADEHHDEAEPHHDEPAVTEEHRDEHAGGASTFGEPADPAEADRAVNVRATDRMRFRPASVNVHAGEVVTFEIKNVGKIPHDFTLGDEAAQDQHAQEMADTGSAMQHDDPNAVIVEPGETASLTWRFHDSGEVLYGCHQPGHYEAGMVGTVDVAP